MLSGKVMKLCIYLLLLVAIPCSACEPTSIEALRKDVEQALVSKSFAGIAEKYGESAGVQVTLENEYDDESPTTILRFKSIAEFSRWFFEKHEFSEHMFIPQPVVCRSEGCRYRQPELTLHHGKYLLGFAAQRAGQCMSLSQIRIQWG
jgi:hypothetical protein